MLHLSAGNRHNGDTGYVLHDPTGQPVMLQTSNGITCLYLNDGVGNPIALSTSFSTTSYALQFDPYGAATRTDTGGNNGGWTQNPYQFHGGLTDRTTGQIKFGQRWYNPSTGTWTQQDKLNAPLDPGNANRYAYSADDPINMTDTAGNAVSCRALWVAAGAAALVAVGLVLGAGAVPALAADLLFGATLFTGLGAFYGTVAGALCG